jgi:carbamoyltransferase
MKSVKDHKVLSLYGSHDSNVTFVDKNNQLRVLEYERISNIRYAALGKNAEHDDLGTDDIIRDQFYSYIKDNIISEPEVILYNGFTEKDDPIFTKHFPNSKRKQVWHHISHAACGFYQSPFDEALILSVDGGGVDDNISTTVRFFYGDNNGITPYDRVDINLGCAYRAIAVPISEIPKTGNGLAWAGKTMGICAYGNIVDEWIEPLVEFFSTYQNHTESDNFNVLQFKLGIDLSKDSLSGQMSFDFAATSQYAFEKLVFSLLEKIISYKETTNLVFTGGCALNVLVNQKLKKYLNERNYNFYVPPNPNDCGLSLGQYLLEVQEKIDPVVYGNFDILDRQKIQEYKSQFKFQDVSVEKIVNLISQGKIGGIIRGYSEVGPRALGNRSIICDPSFADMKDVLNSKVKFREWFRPFAPVCRYEDRNLYFDDAYESVYMSYAPVVKEKYRELLPSITHADNTSRLQTVRKEQHELFYDILTEMNNIEKIPVILNTSFNIKGRPILTTYEDAFFVLKETELDFLVTEDFIVEK